VAGERHGHRNCDIRDFGERAEAINDAGLERYVRGALLEFIRDADGESQQAVGAEADVATQKVREAGRQYSGAAQQHQAKGNLHDD
jgi:hypothetical protein